MNLRVGMLLPQGEVQALDFGEGLALVKDASGEQHWLDAEKLDEERRAKLRENVLKVGKLYGVACLDNEALTSESTAKELGSRLRWTLQGIENMARDAGVELRQLPESIRLACAPEDDVVEMRVEWRIK